MFCVLAGKIIPFGKVAEARSDPPPHPPIQEQDKTNETILVFT